MGCDPWIFTTVLYISNFNPRTHVGCDFEMVKASPLLLYFNPRTHVGCDHNTHIETVPSGDFNPRTHVGCDILSAAIYEERKISIHAPTWGATCTPTLMSKINEISIHAPTWGATSLRPYALIASQFQSTHPRGVRRERSGHILGSSLISIHAPTWGATGVDGIQAAE